MTICGDGTASGVAPKRTIEAPLAGFALTSTQIWSFESQASVEAQSLFEAHTG
jgi:hypothetical protein